MARNWTVGPWSFTQAGGLIKDTANNAVAVVCARRKTANGDGYEDVPRAEVEANLRLQAAAPDMVQALELAEATIERLNRHNSADGTLQVIRAALKKAEGGE